MAYKKVMAAAFAVTLFLAGCAGSTDKGTSPAACPVEGDDESDICSPAGSRR